MTVLRWVQRHVLKIPVSSAKVCCWVLLAHAGVTSLKDATVAAIANMQKLNSHSQSNNSHIMRDDQKMFTPGTLEEWDFFIPHTTLGLRKFKTSFWNAASAFPHRREWFDLKHKVLWGIFGEDCSGIPFPQQKQPIVCLHAISRTLTKHVKIKIRE